MELGHSKEYSVEVPRKKLTAGRQDGNSISKIDAPKDWNRSMSSGSGEGGELFKFGDEDLATRKPIIAENYERSVEPQ